MITPIASIRSKVDARGRVGARFPVAVTPAAALYLLLLVLPGGSVFALIAWLCRRRSSSIASRGA